VADTIHLRVAGGDVMPHRVPLHWAIQEQLDKGHVARVNEDGSPWTEPAPEPEPDPDAVPEGNVTDVLAWVGDDKARAERALNAEWAKGDAQRKGVVDPLAKMLGLEQ
jgi:hypothetical protein